MIRIGSSGLSSLMRPSVVRPSLSGMRMSMSTTSTSFSRTNFTAACAEATLATILISVSASRLCNPNPYRIRGTAVAVTGELLCPQKAALLSQNLRLLADNIR
jgi:hypothetical protein